MSNLLLPVGSLVYLLFCVSRWGWGFESYLEEANTGVGLKLSRAAQAVAFHYIAGFDCGDSGAGIVVGLYVAIKRSAAGEGRRFFLYLDLCL